MTKVFDGGDYRAAELMLVRDTADFPRDADLLVRYALCATNSGRAFDALPRWQAVVAMAPDLPLGWCGVASSYRSFGAFAPAQEAIGHALRRFPDDLTVLTEAARLNMTRSHNEEALALWTKILASGAVHPDWLFSQAETLLALERYDEAEDTLLALRAAAPDHVGVGPLAHAIKQHRMLEHDDRPAPARYRTPPADATPIAPGDLVMRFESLGDNCEFGLVQRYCFAEPLGLFRFSFPHLDKLVRLLNENFAFYGDAGDVELVINKGDQSYDCLSHHYQSFRYHTEVFSYETEASTLLAREAKKIKYLIRRLKDDLSSAEKIFVRKGEPFESAGPLARALRAHGPVTLLWVEEADADHPPGSVEVVEPKLLCGRVDRFAPYGNAHDINLVTWMDLLCNAVRLTSGERLVAEANRPLAAGHNWAMTERAERETVSAPRFPGAKTQRLRLLMDTERAFSAVAMRLLAPEIVPRTLITFSLWVLVPDAFKGSVVDIFFTNCSVGYVGHADLRKREVWQRIFASTRLPKEQPRAAVGIRITGCKGDTIYIASWHLETGCIPNRLADASLEAADHAKLLTETIAIGTSAGVKV